MKTISRRYRVHAVSSLFAGALLAGLVAVGVMTGDHPTTAQAQQGTNAMAVDAVPGGGVDSSRTVTGSGTFDVDVLITGAPTSYAGYGSKLEFDPSILAADSHSYLAGAVFDLCAAGTIGAGSVKSGCALSGGTTTFTGATDRIAFRCIANGVSLLRLVPPADAISNTTTLGPGGTTVPTALADAQITCGDGAGPAPTPSGASPTPTPLGPAPTPVGPAATPTPLPPGLEAVPLVAGCNPVASTYPDGTPIQTIADRVGPAGNLVSLWMFELGTWQAFSPQFPQVSDLTEADLLDVVFACVGGPGDFVRPVV